MEMKNLKKFRLMLISMITLSLLVVSNASAATSKLTIVPLYSSGTGSSYSFSRDITGFTAEESCGGTYRITHTINYANYTSTQFRFLTNYFKITILNGTVSGGVGFIGNYEDTANNYYQYKYSGVKLSQDVLYNYPWNTTVYLGSNKNAHYDITTRSGYPMPAQICDNEDKVIMDVGGKNTSVAITSSAIPEQFSKNKKDLSNQLGETFKENSKMVSNNAMINHFYQMENDVILTQQTGSPVLIGDVNEDDFVTYNENGFKYELAHFFNADEIRMNVMRFKANGTYMALVTDSSLEETLKIAHSFTKAPGNK